MGRPEAEPKTPLAHRLKQVRKHLGYAERDDFCHLVGISKSTIAFYERGDRTPDAKVLASYQDKFGVNMNWLIAGNGGMFSDLSKAPASARAVDPVLMEKLARIVTSVHKAADIKISAEKAIVETTGLYNELIARVTDMNDLDEIEATLPQLRYVLKKRLDLAAIEPATGKRSVS